jgi:hypothetical protein
MIAPPSWCHRGIIGRADIAGEVISIVVARQLWRRLPWR